MPTKRHIVLMGFKHVGKSVIGQSLAQKLSLPFYELDAVIETLYRGRTGDSQTCREIVAAHGEDYFRALETKALQETLQKTAGVIALGGGAVMKDANRSLICAQIPVHITAPQDIVRARVTAAAWPQAVRFDEIWHEREPVYRQLAQFTVENNGSLDDVMTQLVEQLK